MRVALLASVALIDLWTQANAASIDVNVANGPLPNTYAPSATSQSGAYEEGKTDSISNVRLSPFAGSIYNGRSYDAVEAGGSATYSASAFGQSTGTGGIFTFIYGSPDTYNTLTFTFGGAFVASLTGSDIGATPQGGYSFVRISGIGSFDAVTFGTGNTNAFEFAAVNPVPLPASLPMFGGALLAVAGLSYGMKRKTNVKNIPAAASA